MNEHMEKIKKGLPGNCRIRKEDELRLEKVRLYLATHNRLLSKLDTITELLDYYIHNKNIKDESK